MSERLHSGLDDLASFADLSALNTGEEGQVSSPTEILL